MGPGWGGKTLAPYIKENSCLNQSCKVFASSHLHLCGSYLMSYLFQQATIQLNLNAEIGMMTQKWVSNQELWSFWHLIPSVSLEKEKALNTPQIPRVSLETWLLPSPCKLCQTHHPVLLPVPMHTPSCSKSPEPKPFPALHAAWAAPLPCSPHSTCPHGMTEGPSMREEKDSGKSRKRALWH